MASRKECFITISVALTSWHRSFRTIVLVHHLNAQRIHWPLCYVACVLEMVGPDDDPVAKEIVSLIGNIQSLSFQKNTLDAGNWWEEVVKIAFLLRFVQSANVWREGPFGLCDGYEAHGAAVLAKRLGPGTRAVSAAKKEIHSELGKLTDGCHLVLFYPSHPNSLEQFDGYVAFIKVENGSSGNSRIIGYQCKAGRESSFGIRKPSWLHKAILLRGEVNGGRAAFPRGWAHASGEEVKAFLGFSLAMLYDLHMMETD